MKDQVSRRNLEAENLASAFARQTGKAISDVVRGALRQYRPGQPRHVEPERVADWRQVLREDREAGLAESPTSIDALYDSATGLPA